MKMENFLGAIIIVTMIFGLFGYILIGGNEQYPINDFSSSEFQQINSYLENTTSLTNQVEGKVLNVTQQTGTIDLIGYYFSAGYDSISIAGKSVGLFTAITFTVANKIGINPIVIKAITAYIMVLFIFGIIWYYIFKVK